MDIKKSSKKVVVDNNQFNKFGVYLWQLPDGKVVMDEDGNYLSIQSELGDIRRMAELAAAADQLNLPEGGKPLFMPGHRKITDEEYEEQIDRMKSGLIPDEYDLPAYLEPNNDR